MATPNEAELSSEFVKALASGTASYADFPAWRAAHRAATPTLQAWKVMFDRALEAGLYDLILGGLRDRLDWPVAIAAYLFGEGFVLFPDGTFRAGYGYGNAAPVENEIARCGPIDPMWDDHKLFDGVERTDVDYEVSYHFGGTRYGEHQKSALAAAMSRAGALPEDGDIAWRDYVWCEVVSHFFDTNLDKLTLEAFQRFVERGLDNHVSRRMSPLVEETLEGIKDMLEERES